jgi:hypothetical protein
MNDRPMGAAVAEATQKTEGRSRRLRLPWLVGGAAIILVALVAAAVPAVAFDLSSRP